ncbi:hypothetical protein STA1M1_31860 [Sinisalibacter aestuarii]|uniref:LamG-like jellyroll fold domain-containing protein n=2 Tax=Sinisalibacter aestuarii TaxID=2949426 RepID=A0ABQ5LYY5_9RHOB|nr:hypothetical protein STA1M1_31860 [Sinisalibacter aestuarii]
MRSRLVLAVALLVLVQFLGASPAQAVCTNPDGAAGAVKFNKAFQVLQYCNDTEWRALGAMPSNAIQGTADGLIGYWRLDETTGTIATDSSPYGHNATYSNVVPGTNTVSAPVQNGIDFSGHTQAAAQTANDNLYSSVIEATFTAWVRLDNATGTGGIIALGNQGLGEFHLQLKNNWNEAKLYLEAQNWSGAVGAWYTTTAVLLPLGSWHHVAVTYSYNDVVGTKPKFYVDGALYTGTVATAQAPAGSFTPPAVAIPTIIGHRHDSSSGQWMGALDDVRVYSRILSAGEIQEIFGIGSHRTESVPYGLVGYWRLDETSGTTAFDSSGNGNDGTVTDTDFSLSTAEGVIGNSFTSFDVNDRATVSDSSVLNPSSEITVSAWVRSTVDYRQRLVEKWNGSNDYQLWIEASSNGSTAAVFEVGTSSGSTWAFGTTPVGNENEWFLLTGTYDGTNVNIYVNGVLENSTPQTGTLNDGSNDLIIGNGSGGAFNGNIDDVRIYNRALTPDEVWQLYDARDGNLRYNTDQRVPEYFNGDAWIAAAGGPYVPGAVYFNSAGTTYLDYAGALTGVTDSKMVTGSFWIRRNASGLGAQQKVFRSSGNAFIIELTTANEVRIKGEDSVGTTQLDATSTATITDTAWHHVMFSANVNAPGAAYFYIDGLDASDAAPTANDVNLYFSVAGQWIGADSAPSQLLDGDLADLWLDFGTYIDLSNADNRRKFITASGDPVDLGSIGQYPTGTAPDIYMSGRATTWATNKGTGGGFTVNGALSDAAGSPTSIPLTSLPQSCPNIGDVCDDGTIYSGLSPDGNLPMFTTSESEGVMPWNNGNATNKVTTSITNDDTGEANTNALILIDSDSGSAGFQTHIAAQYCFDLASHGADDWYLPAPNEFANLLSNYGVMNLPTTGGAGIQMHWVSREAGVNDAQDYGVYPSSPLSGSDAKELNRNVRCVRKGPAPRCANPVRPSGAIIYNADFNLLQYCDPYSGGTGWRATTE